MAKPHSEKTVRFLGQSNLSLKWSSGKPTSCSKHLWWVFQGWCQKKIDSEYQKKGSIRNPYWTRIQPVFYPYQPIFLNTKTWVSMKNLVFPNPYWTRTKPIFNPSQPIFFLWVRKAWKLPLFWPIRVTFTQLEFPLLSNSWGSHSIAWRKQRYILVSIATSWKQ